MNILIIITIIAVCVYIAYAANINAKLCKEWCFDYGDYKIRVKKHSTKSEIFVNDKLSAEGGMFSYSVYGNLDNGEEFTVKFPKSVEDVESYKPSVFIGNKQIFQQGTGGSGSSYSSTGSYRRPQSYTGSLSGIIEMIGDSSQASTAQSNYEAGKFCSSCTQADTTRCTRAIMIAAYSAGGSPSNIELVLQRFSLCFAGPPNNKSAATCNKYGIGTTV